MSRRLGESGRVVVRVLIGPDGRAQEARIQRSSGYERLDQVALETARDRWRYVPAAARPRRCGSTSRSISYWSNQAMNNEFGLLHVWAQATGSRAACSARCC